jgi:hypothetical protein
MNSNTFKIVAKIPLRMITASDIDGNTDGDLPKILGGTRLGSGTTGCSFWSGSKND